MAAVSIDSLIDSLIDGDTLRLSGKFAGLSRDEKDARVVSLLKRIPSLRVTGITIDISFNLLAEKDVLKLVFAGNASPSVVFMILTGNIVTTRGGYIMFNKLGSKTYRTFLAIGDFLSANSIVEEAVYRLVASKPQKRKADQVRDMIRHDWCFEPFCIILQEWADKKHLFKPAPFEKRAEMVERWARRVKYLEYLKKHPEIHDIQIAPPVVIVGLFRTGTTLLFNLMAKCKGARSPMLWEIMNPTPPPKKETYETDARIAMAEKKVEEINRTGYTVKEMHEMKAQWPEECMFYMREELFCTELWFTQAYPKYNQWLEGQNQFEVYDKCKLFLKVIGCKYPPESHWVLKAPYHLLRMDELLHTYGEETKLVLTHRDPLKAMASTISLWTYIGKVEWRNYDEKKAARFILEQMAGGWRRTMKLLDERGDKLNVQHVYFDDMMKNPKQMVENLHSAFGLPWDAENHARMQEWLDDNPRGKHGKHEYSLEQYGLTEEDVVRAFLPYYQRFYPKELERMGYQSGERDAPASRL